MAEPEVRASCLETALSGSIAGAIQRERSGRSANFDRELGLKASTILLMPRLCLTTKVVEFRMMSQTVPSANHEPLHFQFEADFVEAWRCIPMRVRLALDTCGVKLKLSHWQALSESVRQQLVEMPCTTGAEADAYRDRLLAWVQQSGKAPPGTLPIPENPAWDNVAIVPEEVGEKAVEFDVSIGPQQWAQLSQLQRFALIKLSRSGHENRNFLPALKEFKLA